MHKITIKEFQNNIYKELLAVTSDANIETEAILEHITKLKKIQIYSNPETPISNEEIKIAKNIIDIFNAR